MTSNSYTPHVFSLHMFLFFFLRASPHTPKLFLLLHHLGHPSLPTMLCLAHDLATGKKQRAVGEVFHCPAGDGIIVGYCPQLLGVRKDHSTERWTQSSCHRSQQITQNQTWSRKDRASGSNTQHCTQRCPLELLLTLSGASNTVRAFVFFLSAQFYWFNIFIK